MTKRIIVDNTFVGFGLLPAKPSSNSIEIYHPFANLASIYFAHRGLDISYLKSGSIKITFDRMSIEERKVLANELKIFFKESRQEIIQDFLIYKKHGISYL
jgi:hypothetical protein